ncbi:MAG TPA: serine/threonine-protein kinase [Pyrinomonadaceae bacterium]|nr:serine/threonine-protein kinase [Pyrinomonadaceae bacterium]
MKPERWHEISRIFEAAKSLNDPARVLYLKEECGADDDLRSEVEKLIDSHKKAEADSFISKPVVDDVGIVLNSNVSEDSSDSLDENQQFGSYLIQRKLGAGGMGEVYLATDQRLDRTVALKILPVSVANDKRRMQRFRQEAKVASSLNQPNILTIYEFGEIDSLSFIATEFVDGDTLRDYMRGKRLKLSEILDISIQILAALDAAHEAKIVHRDMKPENVMLRRRDHVVKVLDFGLAKLTEPRAGTATREQTDAEAATEFKSIPGNLMGTINYMSPEQAQAHVVDERTDLWSVGVMIYEMVAGVMPFKGITPAHTIVQILEKDPSALTQLDSTLPPELQRIVNKAMSKRFDERYQTAKDMMIDLRLLRKQLDGVSELGHSTSPVVTPTPAIPTAEQKITTAKAPMKAVTTRRNPLVIFLPLAVLLVALAGWFVWNRSRSQSLVPTPPLVAPSRDLTYSITLQKYRDNRAFEEPIQLAREILFERGYQLRLNLKSSQSGFLYVINEGPHQPNEAPEYVVLFPSPTSNRGSALLQENVNLQIPENSWFRLDSDKGTEKVWLIYAPNELSELEPVREFANPKTRGLIDNASVRDKVTSFLKSHSESKPIVEASDEKKETTLRSRGDVLVYSLALEHY